MVVGCDWSAIGCRYSVTVALETRFNTHYQNAYKQKKGVSNPLIKTALRLSSAKITLKVVWKH